jgi:hypothetical protein
MALRAVPDHPKFADLKSKLGLPKGASLGWLEALWHFTGRFTPQGNIGKYTDQAIEAWVEWDGAPGELVAALIETGWLDKDCDHRILVHDWREHADKATKNALSRANLTFCTPGVRTEGVRCTYTNPESGTVYRLPVPEPVPVPVPEPVPAPKYGAAKDGAGREGEFMAASHILEELNVVGRRSLVPVVAESIQGLVKEGGDLESAISFIVNAGNEAIAYGEVIDRFWFTGQKYRPVTPTKTRKQREKEARLKAFMESTGD